MTPEETDAYAQLVFPVLGITAFVFFSIGVRVGYLFAPEKRVFRG